MTQHNKEMLVGKIHELEAKLQPFGLKKIQSINYEVNSCYEHGKWVAEVEEMKFIVENQEGETDEIDDFQFLTSFLDMEQEQIDDFEEVADELQDEYYYTIMRIVEKMQNKSMSTDDLILLHHLRRTEEESISFVS